MSMTAFFKQGFVPFEQALGSQVADLGEVVERVRGPVLAIAAGGAPRRPALIGIGASLAALAAPVDLLRRNGIPASRLSTAEIEDCDVDLGDVVLALSQSGRSRETVAAFRRSSARRIAVVNVTGSPLAQEADEVVTLGHLSDSLASSTGYTASVVAVSMLAEAWVHGRPSPEWESIGERVGEFVSSSAADVARLVELVQASQALDVVSPVARLGAAEAASLLVREVARVPTAAFETRQYLHGQMEATGPGTAHIVLGGEDGHQVVGPLQRSGRSVVLVSPDTDLHDRAAGPAVVRIPSRSSLEEPVFIGVLFQQLCLRLAQLRGIDPDEFLFLESDTKLDDVP